MGCCLGLAAICEGATLRSLDGAETPNAVDTLPEPFANAWIRYGDNFRVEAEVANDHRMTESDRERKVADVFKQARGWNVEFED
jgi:hypothetical protein